MEWEIGAPGKAYTKWAADMAVGLGTGVPWVMCKQDDAPDPVVSIKQSLQFIFNIYIFLKNIYTREITKKKVGLFNIISLLFFIFLK